MFFPCFSHEKYRFPVNLPFNQSAPAPSAGPRAGRPRLAPAWRAPPARLGFPVNFPIIQFCKASFMWWDWSMWRFPKMGKTPIAGWFVRENPMKIIKMDDMDD